MGIRRGSAADFYRILENSPGRLGGRFLPGKKIFGIFEKIICICEKMGYNKVEYPSGEAAAKGRCARWSTKER
ncbi:MAG: hypothetical protein PUD80_01480 [Firmicutes bacterium]|nr:hypothetical protein [Bacillota bacterium]